ncbi:MAG: protein translocase subunit SecF [Micrococcales bacterium]|nr:MAG: protein translocase subunit SecF [Micrococcales bacterium]PIE26581.1 MAG: protein translocase subunit SecF [Micrococcales bacterium]
MFSLARLGNDLYSGERSIDFVGNWKRWLGLGGLLTAVSALLIAINGFNPGIEFRGGTQFRVQAGADAEQSVATDAVAKVLGETTEARVSLVGEQTVQVQTQTMTEQQKTELREALAAGYGVPAGEVTASFVGASWGQDVTRQALTGLVVFLVLVSVLLIVYFRAWQMAVAALVALAHDLLITAGVYSATGFEVTPAAVIGFLTILGYSLYDTMVVFDKVRENTKAALLHGTSTYAEAANTAINQTVVRSINTSVVALLPVAAILFIGAFLLGAGTLKDISLALLVGMLVGTFSSVFIATPLLVALRGRDAQVRALADRVAVARGTREPVTVGATKSEATSESDQASET